MNRFGEQALRAFSEYAPERLAAIGDPEAFFSQLGLDAEAAWVELWPTMVAAGPNTNGDSALEIGRIRQAQLAADEVIFADWCMPVDVADQDDTEPWPLGAALDEASREARSEVGDPLPQELDVVWSPTR